MERGHRPGETQEGLRRAPWVDGGAQWHHRRAGGTKQAVASIFGKPLSTHIEAADMLTLPKEDLVYFLILSL